MNSFVKTHALKHFLFILSIQGCNSELSPYIRESFSTAVLAHFQSTFEDIHLKMAENQSFETENPVLLKKQFSSVKSFQLWLFWFLFYTGVFSHLGMSVILQIITGYVGRTVVEVYMNILSVLHNLQCLVFPITIKERVPLRTFRHPFLSGLLCS